MYYLIVKGQNKNENRVKIKKSGDKMHYVKIPKEFG